MIFLKSNRKKEQFIQISLIVITVIMTVLRFLLNEKGRMSPDSVRFFRTSKLFPVIDSTTTPLGYPLSLKFFTIFGFDEFWASKIVGIFAYLFIIWFAWKKKFYLKETIIIGGLFSYVSIFSYSMSESLIIPFIFVFLYFSKEIILENIKKMKAIFYLSFLLILLYNIRYSALFIMGGVFGFGILNFRKKYAQPFIISSIIGFAFVVLYKFLFIDYFNELYVKQFLEIGLHPTSKLLTELFQGLTTSFNPFVHIANPSGGIINYGIYGIGAANIILMILIFIKNKLSETEKYLVFIGFTGIVCSYFIQYFYSVNALDYRLLTPFILSIWMVYFKKLYQIFGKLTYGITALSLLTGFAFTWLSKGNYLQNRKQMNEFLTSENLKNIPLKFYTTSEEDLDKVQVAELISTINPNIKLTFKPEDSLKKNVLTEYKILQKIKIDKNKYQ
mgnify:CR=1 FL=1